MIADRATAVTVDEGDFSEVARILTQARKARGLSIEGVASSLCIRSEYINAIEAGRFHDVPGATYTIGFVRSYARFLDLDSNALISRLREEQPKLLQQPLDAPSTRSAEVVKMREEWNFPTAKVGFAVVALVAAIYAWNAFSKKQGSVPTGEKTNTASFAPVQQQEAAPTTLNEAPVVDAGTAATLPSTLQPSPVPLVETQTPALAWSETIVLTARSRLQYTLKTAEGKAHTDATLEPGQSVVLPAEAGLDMVLSSAQAAQFSINGTELGSLSGRGNRLIKNFSPTELRRLTGAVQ
ncbi:MAG: RodZ domain-containing protein [Holosporales bacterium]